MITILKVMRGILVLLAVLSLGDGDPIQLLAAILVTLLFNALISEAQQER